ncbi:MAG: hypothetical protein ACYCU7_07090 [Acidimicrobiales bacterium]
MDRSGLPSGEDTDPRYKPTSPHLLGRISPAGLRYVVAAVDRLGLQGGDRARVRFHLALHVAFVEEGRDRQASELTDKEVFAAGLIDASIDDASTRLPSTSPYAADLCRVAKVVRPAGRPRRRLIVKSPTRQGPYDDDEIGALEAVSRGLSARERESYLGALALGFGCGIVGPEADLARSSLLADHDGILFMARPHSGRPVPVSAPWDRVLRRMLTAGCGKVTEAYSVAGRQRLQRALKCATGRPEFRPERFRTTWLCSQLRANVPADVVAWSLDMAPWTVAQFVPFLPAPTDAEVSFWLGGSFVATPRNDRPSLETIVCGQPAPRVGTPAFDVGAFRPKHHLAAIAWDAGLGQEVAAVLTAVEHPRNLCDRVLVAARLGLYSAGHPPDARSAASGNDARVRVSPPNRARNGPRHVGRERCSLACGVWPPSPACVLQSRRVQRTAIPPRPTAKQSSRRSTPGAASWE